MSRTYAWRKDETSHSSFNPIQLAQLCAKSDTLLYRRGGGCFCFCFCVFVFVFISNIVLSQCAYDYVSCIELKEHSYAHRVEPRYTAAKYAGGEGGVGGSGDYK